MNAGRVARRTPLAPIDRDAGETDEYGGDGRDVARIAEMREAISTGSFAVDAEAVADGLFAASPSPPPHRR